MRGAATAAATRTSRTTQLLFKAARPRTSKVTTHSISIYGLRAEHPRMNFRRPKSKDTSSTVLRRDTACAAWARRTKVGPANTNQPWHLASDHHRQQLPSHQKGPSTSFCDWSVCRCALSLGLGQVSCYQSYSPPFHQRYFHYYPGNRVLVVRLPVLARRVVPVPRFCCARRIASAKHTVLPGT